MTFVAAAIYVSMSPLERRHPARRRGDPPPRPAASSRCCWRVGITIALSASRDWSLVDRRRDPARLRDRSRWIARHAPRHRRASARATDAPLHGRRRPVRRRGRDAAAPSRALAGTSQIAPSSVQQRTMSRIDRMPAISPPSMTMRWRKPPRTIATAASSSDQSGAAKTTSDVRWSPTRSPSGSWPAPIDVEHVALGEDARARPSGSITTAAPTLRSRHQAGGLAQRVPGPDRAGPSCSCRLVPASRPLPPSDVRHCNDCLNVEVGQSSTGSRPEPMPRRQSLRDGRQVCHPSGNRGAVQPLKRVCTRPATIRLPHEPLRGRHRDRRGRVRLATSRSTTSRAASPRRAASCSAPTPRSATRRSASTSPPCAWTRAAELLADRGLTVREVAHRVGYRQPAQFAKAFRRHHGVVPVGATAAAALRATAAPAQPPARREPPPERPAPIAAATRPRTPSRRRVRVASIARSHRIRADGRGERTAEAPTRRGRRIVGQMIVVGVIASVVGIAIGPADRLVPARRPRRRPTRSTRSGTS